MIGEEVLQEFINEALDKKFKTYFKKYKTDIENNDEYIHISCFGVFLIQKRFFLEIK